MTLNMTAPISSIGGISSISPIRMDCWDNIKMMVSPIGSESSGVSSLDSEDMKILPSSVQKCSEEIKRDLQINYNGRNILDLFDNLDTNSKSWSFQYSHLPERNNISMFWANRSLYNRLGPNGLTPVYTISKCECCDFQFTSDCPNNSYLSETSLMLSSTTPSPMIFTTAPSSNNNKTTEFRSLQNALPETPNIYMSSGLKNQMHLRANKQQQQQQQLNENKSKLSDMYQRNTFNPSNNNINNINGFTNNVNKLNNVMMGSNKSKTDAPQLASNIVSTNFTNSTSYTPPLIGFGNKSNMLHNNDFSEIMTKNSKPLVPNNNFNNNNNNISLNTISSSNIPSSANNGFHGNGNNINVIPNNFPQNHVQTSSSSNNNNLFSLFNSNSNTNNTVNHAFSANVESNMNSYNAINNNNRNNFSNTNQLTVNSQQNYGRVYKYF